MFLDISNVHKNFYFLFFIAVNLSYSSQPGIPLIQLSLKFFYQLYYKKIINKKVVSQSTAILYSSVLLLSNYSNLNSKMHQFTYYIILQKNIQCKLFLHTIYILRNRINENLFFHSLYI